MNRAQDWLDQAKRDLDHARKSMGLEHFEWACFAAQQAAERTGKNGEESSEGLPDQ